MRRLTLQLKKQKERKIKMINKKGLELVKEYLENNYNIQVE